MSLTASARHLYYHSGIGKLSREELEAVYEYIKKCEEKDRMLKPIVNELQYYESGVNNLKK